MSYENLTRSKEQSSKGTDGSLVLSRGTFRGNSSVTAVSGDDIQSCIPVTGICM